MIILAGLLMIFTYSSIAEIQQPSASANPHTHNIAKIADSDEFISTYKYISTTDTIQEKQDLQSLLKTKGIEIFSIESGYDGLLYPLKSEEPSSLTQHFHHGHAHQGYISILQIKKSDWQKLTEMDSDFHLCLDLQEKGGDCHVFHYSNLFPQLKDKPYVFIYKYSNQIQCQSNSGYKIHEMEKDLTTKNIVVYQKYEGTSGELVPVQCGDKTNHINVYVIEKSKLGTALSIGFRECAWLETNNLGCYRL